MAFLLIILFSFLLRPSRYLFLCKYKIASSIRQSFSSSIAAVEEENATYTLTYSHTTCTHTFTVLRCAWIKVRNFKIRVMLFSVNKQECIAIMLLCLNHGHSEHKQKAEVHGYSYWSMTTFMTSYWVAAQITRSRPAIATNAYAWCCY